MRWASRLHHYIGLLAALFVLILSASGLLLNHADALGLGQIPAGSTALRAWYGIKAPPLPDGYRVDDLYVTQLGDNLYLDAARISRAPGELIGIADHDGVLVVGLSERVMLFTFDGQLIEDITLDTPLTRVGRTADGRVVLETATGLLKADPDLTEWQRVQNSTVTWAEAHALPEDLSARIAADYLENALNWERVLLDLHSGRLFGAAGELVMDLAAICMLILAATGIWLFFRRQRTNGS